MHVNIVYVGNNQAALNLFGQQKFSRSQAYTALAGSAIAAAVSLADLEKQEGVIGTIKKFLAMVTEKIKSALAAGKEQVASKLRDQHGVAAQHLKEAQKKFSDMKEFAERLKQKLKEAHEHILRAEEKHADPKQVMKLKGKYNESYESFYGKPYYKVA